MTTELEKKKELKRNVNITINSLIRSGMTIREAIDLFCKTTGWEREYVEELVLK